MRIIAKVRHFLFQKDCEKVVNAFISSRLDYCSALYSEVSQASLHKLKVVQNAAAILLTKTKKSDHITPVLAELHWLPVRSRVDFIVCF